MDAETIGLISGLIVVASGIPYCIRAYQGKVHPNLTSWTLWATIGLVLLLTYRSSGAESNAWPALFGFTNPLLVTIIAKWRQRQKWTKMNKSEVWCFSISLMSLGAWVIVRDEKSLSQWALYLALVADACAAIPTILFVWKHPMGDRPFAWFLYSIGYALALFALPEQTFVNYALPVYMFFGSSIIGVPLLLHRLRERVPLKEWI